MKKGLIKTIVIAAICLAGAGAGAYYWLKPDTVKVVVAQKADISPVLSGVGRIEGSRKITVYSDVEGIVSDRYIVVGDRVKRGDILIGYGDDTQKKQLTAAEIDVQFSKKALEAIQTLRTGYQNTINSANAQIADCERRYADIESQILMLDSSNHNDEYSQAMRKSSNEEKINDLELQIQDKQTELSKAELEFKEIELISSEDTSSLESKLNSLLQRIRDYQSEIAALNQQISEYQSDSISMPVEGMNPETYDQYLKLKNDLESVMRKWTDAKTQKETAQSMLSAYEQLSTYEQQLAQDELVLTNAENELKKSKAGTVAAADGIITECLVDVGAYVDKGTPIIEMQSDDSYKVRMMISKYDIASVKIGQEADIKVGNQQFSGKVEKIDQSAETDISGKAKASIIISLDTDQSMIIGLDADVSLYLESAEDVISVPSDCLFTDDSGSYVYVYENDSVKKHYVEVGKSDSKYSQIDGLAEGTHVACEPNSANYVGEKVKETVVEFN